MLVLKDQAISTQDLLPIPATTVKLEFRNCQSSEWKAIGKYLLGDDPVCSKLRQLKIVECDCDNTVFSDASLQNGLEVLILHRNPHLFEKLETGFLRHLPNLTDLDLDSYPDLVPETVVDQILGRIPKLQSIKFDERCVYSKAMKLRDAAHKIGKEGARFISNFFPNLTYLDLYKSNIGTEGAIVIGKGLPNLYYLNICTLGVNVVGNGVGTEGLVRITHYLRKLVNLYTSENGVQNEAAFELAKNLSMLSNLYIRNNSILPFGALQIACKIPTLRELWVTIPQFNRSKLERIFGRDVYINFS